MFFDTEQYFADSLFIRHNVRVWFDGEYTKEDFPYRIIICHIKKRDIISFLEALEDLKNSMAICGHPKYREEVTLLMDSIIPPD